MVKQLQVFAALDKSNEYFIDELKSAMGMYHLQYRQMHISKYLWAHPTKTM